MHRLTAARQQHEARAAGAPDKTGGQFQTDVVAFTAHMADDHHGGHGRLGRTTTTTTTGACTKLQGSAQARREHAQREPRASTSHQGGPSLLGLSIFFSFSFLFFFDDVSFPE